MKKSTSTSPLQGTQPTAAKDFVIHVEDTEIESETKKRSAAMLLIPDEVGYELRLRWHDVVHATLATGC